MTTPTPEQYTFQAEIAQLLQLLSHSLYQNREIAIRELVSNASDAVDKARFLSLSEDSIGSDEEFEIAIEPDKDEKVLAIRDNGIGMTRDELVANLGTIARSGSLEFVNRLSGDEQSDLSLIGQFGVGFYSAFMLADRVEVVTRSHTEDSGWRWESDGTGSFTIEAADVESRGTSIRLHLKADLATEFTEPARLKYILSKYSTFVPHPIRLDGDHVNDQPPIWVEPKSSLTQEQYDEFYQYLTHRPTEKPLWHLHLAADSPLQFYSILYCPPTNFETMGFGRDEHGLHLCAKRILVQNDNRDLMPEYLRFLQGLVDSSDLPLNVSRESLQDNTIFRKMRKVLVKRVLDHLAKTAEDNEDEYSAFYKQFGVILREGVSTDYDNKDRIAGLLRFASSHGDADAVVSLDSYLDRAGEDQKQIYFLGGADRASIERNPNLEVFRKRNLEVLYLTDAADEFVLSHVKTYKEFEIVSVDAADLSLPEASAGEQSEDEASEEPDAAGLGLVLKLFREALGERVADVRKSERLTESACCIVNPEGGMSTQMQKVLQINAPGFEMNKLILEVNPTAPLIQRLCEIVKNDANSVFVSDCGCQLYANALVQAGLAPDGDEMANRVQRFMLDLAQNKSGIVT